MTVCRPDLRPAHTPLCQRNRQTTKRVQESESVVGDDRLELMIGINKGLFTYYVSQNRGPPDPPPSVSKCQHLPHPPSPLVSFCQLLPDPPSKRIILTFFRKCDFFSRSVNCAPKIHFEKVQYQKQNLIL